MRGKRLHGIHWWVRKWADLRGASPAVTCDGGVVTWSELDRRVDVLAPHSTSSASEPVTELAASCRTAWSSLWPCTRRRGPWRSSYRSTSGTRRPSSGSRSATPGWPLLRSTRASPVSWPVPRRPWPADRVLWRARWPDGPRWDLLRVACCWGRRRLPAFHLGQHGHPPRGAAHGGCLPVDLHGPHPDPPLLPRRCYGLVDAALLYRRPQRGHRPRALRRRARADIRVRR